MSRVVLIALGIALQTSLVIHIYTLIGYISTKKIQHFKNFMITAITNIFLSVGVAIMVVINPKVLQGFRLDNIFIIESGMLFIYMMAVKVRVTMGIIRRARNPENYHFSHFGRKVYNTSIIDGKEILTYFITFPFTMMAGAYFIVKIIQFR
jgi:hypothetical protein